MTVVSIIREPDDPIADVRISLGTPRGLLNMDMFYIVFRGDPEKAIELLEKALVAAKEALPEGKYDDHRRPQG
jgi:hypothetical protein